MGGSSGELPSCCKLASKRTKTRVASNSTAVSKHFLNPVVRTANKTHIHTEPDIQCRDRRERERAFQLSRTSWKYGLKTRCSICSSRIAACTGKARTSKGEREGARRRDRYVNSHTCLICRPGNYSSLVRISVLRVAVILFVFDLRRYRCQHRSPLKTHLFQSRIQCIICRHLPFRSV